MAKMADGRGIKPYEQNGFPRLFLLYDVSQHLHDGLGGDLSSEINVVRSLRSACSLYAVNVNRSKI